MRQEEQKRKALGSRGKDSEKEVREYLERLNRRVAAFDWARIYDARSAGGKFPSRPGDYEFYREGRFGLIEVKETEHEYRLPKTKNFANQLPKLKKRELAGGVIVILVSHSMTGLWRRVPLSFFMDRISQPSWDLHEWTTWDSAEDAIRHGVPALR